MADRDPQIARGRRVASYEADFSAWSAGQAAALQEGRYGDLDIVNLVDEVESLGRSEFDAFVSAIEIVLVHMLKWDAQPEKRTPSWVASIVEHRRRIDRRLRDNPSFKSRLEDATQRAFEVATAKAAAETNLPLEAFPEVNSYDWDAITTRPYQLPASSRRNRKTA